jgi:hypothetical protein
MRKSTIVETSVGRTKVINLEGEEIGTTATTYASGDLIGGKLTLTDACLEVGSEATLVSVTIGDLDKQNQPLDVIIFNSDPSGTTFTNDSALDVADADLPKICGSVSVVAGDYADFADSSVATKTNIGLVCEAVGSDDLYACIVSRGTGTYTESALNIKLTFYQDF